MYDQVLTSCRELSLSVSPVPALVVLGQDLIVSKDSDYLTINGTQFPLEDIVKIYNLYQLFQKEGVKIDVPAIYIPLEFVRHVEDFSFTLADGDDPKNIMLRSFFSNETINEVIFRYFVNYKGFDYLDTMSTEEISDELKDYELIDDIHLSLWTSFYLIEKKRMIFSSAEAYKDPYGYSDKTFIASDKTISTQVGSAFTVTENQKSAGKDTEGFTALWGDSDSYLSKQQLYIRTKFEKMFHDYSLRDNTGVSSNIPLIKDWKPFEWARGDSLSNLTTEILSKSNNYVIKV
jgi:hypothetical protein